MTNKERKIETYEDLFILEPNPLISTYILGHLQVEFLLHKIIEIIHPDLANFANSISHYKIIELAHGLGLIDKNHKDALVEINKLRNKLAHNITFVPSVKDFIRIFKLAQKAFTDMTDGISQGLDELNNIDEITEDFDFHISDMFSQIIYDLHPIYCNLGGHEWEFKKGK